MSTTGRTSVGRYELRRRLGIGGMGTVWHAWDPALQRDVAVKEVLLPEGMSDDDRSDAHARTLREAQATARISHRAVVTIHDVLEHDSSPWIVMELLTGASLQEHIDAEGRMTVDRVEEAARALLGGLKAAHAVGVTHRDVKPANIMLTEDDETVLTDFGIANVDGGAAITQTGVYVGSPEFMAPERFEGDRALPASDLWSLGVTLYTLLEGVSPFKRDSITGMMSAVLTAPVPPELTRNEHAKTPQGAALRALIGALLTRDVSARPGPREALDLLERERQSAQKHVRTQKAPLPDLSEIPTERIDLAGNGPGQPGKSGAEEAEQAGKADAADSAPAAPQARTPGQAEAPGKAERSAEAEAPGQGGTPVRRSPSGPNQAEQSAGGGQGGQGSQLPADAPAGAAGPRSGGDAPNPYVIPGPGTPAKGQRPPSGPQQPPPPAHPRQGQQAPQQAQRHPSGPQAGGYAQAPPYAMDGRPDPGGNARMPVGSPGAPGAPGNPGSPGSPGAPEALPADAGMRFLHGVGHTGRNPDSPPAQSGYGSRADTERPASVLTAVVMLGLNALILFLITVLALVQLGSGGFVSGWGTVLVPGAWGLMSACATFGLLSRSRLVYALVLAMQGVAAASLALIMVAVLLYTPALLTLFSMMLLYTLTTVGLLVAPKRARAHFGLG
ncbi:serine/threonine-protein kinase [Nocardiopsis nanhaiensis]